MSGVLADSPAADLRTLEIACWEEELESAEADLSSTGPRIATARAKAAHWRRFDHPDAEIHEVCAEQGVVGALAAFGRAEERRNAARWHLERLNALTDVT